MGEEMGMEVLGMQLGAQVAFLGARPALDSLIMRAGHFRYFLIFSIIKNDFLQFLSN